MNTLFTGQYLLRLDSVGSTNSYALGMLRSGEVPEGTVIIARSQPEGRGQRGNTWESETGKNLTLSIVYKPQFLPVAQQFDLTRAISLAVCDLLREVLPEGKVKIKWPNDILAGELKIAGILIENVLREHIIMASVAGIGLNVNQEAFAFAPQAVSMFNVAGRDFDLQELTEILCDHLEARYLQLRSGKTAALREAYNRELFGLGKKLRFKEGEREFYAIMKGVTESGQLRLEEEGKERLFSFKEVGWLKG